MKIQTANKIVIIISLSMLIAYDVSIRIKATETSQASKDMCGFLLKRPNMTEKNMGLYSHDGFHCVVTINRELEEIEENTMHEECHGFVDRETQHFTGGKI